MNFSMVSLFLALAFAISATSALARNQAGKQAKPKAGISDYELTGKNAMDGQAMPMEMILHHCPILCSPKEQQHPLRHLVPRYSLYGECMDDCICAAYCYMIDSTAVGIDSMQDIGSEETSYDVCFSRCSLEVKPFTNNEA